MESRGPRVFFRGSGDLFLKKIHHPKVGSKKSDPTGPTELGDLGVPRWPLGSLPQIFDGLVGWKT